MRDAQARGQAVEAVAIGSKGYGFLNRIGAKVVSHAVALGDAPQLDRLIGPVKVMLDAFVARRGRLACTCATRSSSTR
jgi:F-type H+-transporting ATPase subunit gamma